MSRANLRRGLTRGLGASELAAAKWAVAPAAAVLMLSACQERPQIGPSEASPPLEEVDHSPLVENTADCMLAVSIPYWDDDNAIRTLRMNADSIDHVSVFWYHLTPTGAIEKYRAASLQRSLIAFAQERGIKVFALVANLPDDEREGQGLTWDPARVGLVLQTQEDRRAHIDDLLQLINSMDFDGIHIDYEALPSSFQADFTNFIAELGEALHQEGKLLAVAVHSKTAENNPREDNGSWAQDWSALAMHVDQLHLMTYSQHTAGSLPGPVASLDWFESILRYAVDGVGLSGEKVFVGVPLYAEEWRRSKGQRPVGLDVDLTFTDVQKRLGEHDSNEFWSEKHASPYAVYTDKSEREHILWFENSRSNRRKLDVARQYGLCNLALWRIGGEDPDLWPLLRHTPHSANDRTDIQFRRGGAY